MDSRNERNDVGRPMAGPDLHEMRSHEMAAVVIALRGREREGDDNDAEPTVRPMRAPFRRP